MRFIGGQSTTAAGGGGYSIDWAPISQSLIDASTAQAGTNDTIKSASVTAGRLTLTYNALGATADGIREHGCLHFDPAAVGIDWSQHDLLVWFDTPTGTNNTAIMAISVLDTPGSTANGVGAYCSSERAGTVGTTAASSSAGGSQDGVCARFTVTGSRVAVVAQSVASGVPTVALGTAASTFGVVNLANSRIAIGAGSYSGGQAEDNTVSADVYFAVVPKIVAPS